MTKPGWFARGALVGALALMVPQVALAKPKLAALAQSRIDAAAKVYAAVEAQWRAGRGTVDAVSTAFRIADARHVRWNEISAKDDGAALAFYQARFGWEVVGSMPMGAMGDYRLLGANGVNIGALMRSGAGHAPGWIYYIGVADIDAAVEKIKTGGGEVLDGPHPVPGGEFSLQARDPQGATFGLVGPRSQARRTDL